MLKMFAIPNCDTVKKARTFLEEKSIAYEFIDFKKYVPTVDDIKRWQIAFKTLPVNIKGTTYKKFKDEFESLSESKKINFIQDHPSMIKRPIIELNGKVISFGFNHEEFADFYK